MFIMELFGNGCSEHGDGGTLPTPKPAAVDPVSGVRTRITGRIVLLSADPTACEVN